MRLLRFLKKSFVNGRIVEVGEEVMMPDSFPLAPHIIDVRAHEDALARGETVAAPVYPTAPQAVFRTDLSHDITAAAGVPVFPTWESQKAFDEITISAKNEQVKIAEQPLLAAPPMTEAEGAAPQPMEITTPDGRKLRWSEDAKEYVPVSENMVDSTSNGA